MLSSRIAAILNSIIPFKDPVHVRGATSVARAYLVACQIESMRQPLIVICPDDDEAQEFYSDLECHSSVFFGRSLKIFNFPTWEQSPYSPITPSLRTRLGRLTTLSALCGQSPDVIITTLAALSQVTLPKNIFLQHSMTLKVQGTLESQSLLARRLTEAGYLRVDPVEDPGTFAIRGEIIDLFPPDRERPLRIELFDDEIERIREFDPSTQRTLNPEATSLKESLMEIFVPPAREVIINPSTASFLREQVKTRADDLGIPRIARDPILASIKDGIYPDHSDAWAPFAYHTPETLWDYLPPDRYPFVVWNDSFKINDYWNKFVNEQQKLEKASTQSERILPAVSSLFCDPKQSTHLKGANSVFLDGMQLYQEATDSDFQVQIETHAQLLQNKQNPLVQIEIALKNWIKQGFRVLVLATTQSQLDRIQFLLDERGISCHHSLPPISSAVTLAVGALSAGFQWVSEGLIVLTENEILNRSGTRKLKSSSTRSTSRSSGKEWSDLQALSDLLTGDLVVHREHGIGKYHGLARLNLTGADSDFLMIEYANKDKLYLPIYRLNVVQKYRGVGGTVNLDRLGSQQFATAKTKVKDAAKKLAFDLVQLYAQRKIHTGIPLSPPDSDYQEFEAKFPYDETADQLKAIHSVLEDLESGRMMDRLICGDVGYGKTEVAMRAAFRAVSDGKQVAVLVPTTILAIQHEQTFRARMKDYPLLIESVTRFKSSKEQKLVLDAVSKGKIDIIIGTHRLLSKDVQFHDLGLMIVDEEHRFGVEHKERLKTLKVNTHVLTLTATPIPRTLHMALSGLRDISLINTPPVDRLPIRTFVSKQDESLIKKAIEFELARGGQVFYLHNRVQTIEKTAARIRELVPQAQVIVAHGQMKEDDLEEAMNRFYQKKGSVLVSTTIIESGLDLPSANTILISRADTLGLAQLYQIRGRVGRGQQRGYAYLFIPDESLITEDAMRRLEVIQRFVELGSGFSVASHDLEIRGGGDLLGAQQSGNIAAVGFDLYTELLDEAIHEIQNQGPALESAAKEPEIKVPFSAFLSEEYIPDIRQRLSLYRRFSASQEEAEIDALEAELQDRFGQLPEEAQNLLWLIRIKVCLKKMKIDSLTVGPEKISLQPGKNSKFDPIRTIALISARPDQYQLMPDSKLVVKLSCTKIQDLFFSLEKLTTDFSSGSP